MPAITNRRSFLRQCLHASALPLGAALLAQCAGRKKTPAAQVTATDNDPCSDLTGVDPVDVQKRKSLGYTSQSPLPDSQCDNCKLWIPVKEGKECGGCPLFTGPVNPGGHCTYWAPQV